MNSKRVSIKLIFLFFIQKLLLKSKKETRIHIQSKSTSWPTLDLEDREPHLLMFHNPCWKINLGRQPVLLPQYTFGTVTCMLDLTHLYNGINIIITLHLCGPHIKVQWKSTRFTHIPSVSAFHHHKLNLRSQLQSFFKKFPYKSSSNWSSKTPS